MTIAGAAQEVLERRAPLAPDLPERAPRPAAPTLDDLGRFIEGALARSATVPFTAMVLPAPSADGTRLLDALSRSDAFAFAPPAGPDVVALGVAARWAVSGPERFVVAQRHATELFASLETIAHPDAPHVLPRVFCGFSFAPGSARAEHWSAFGDGLVTLPRWSYFSGPSGRAALVCALDRRLDAPDRHLRLRAELESILAALGEPHPIADPAPVVSVRHEAPELHAARVASVLREIEQGHVEKVVVSRHAEATTSRRFDEGPTYRALVRGARRLATVFLVRRSGSSFCGATPEHLLTISGSALRTEALAGTAPSGDAASSARLLASEKDGVEHRLVVDAIRSALEPLATSVRVDGTPGVTTAGPVLHLRTRIDATLRAGVTPLEVAASLHPTPAVAGAPRDVAARLIEHIEPGRGWYAGPIGWLDASGDAELVVALRSGLVRGGRALAFAGGGIVSGSTPEQERIETELKMRPFLDALGADPASGLQGPDRPTGSG